MLHHGGRSAVALKLPNQVSEEVYSLCSVLKENRGAFPNSIVSQLSSQVPLNSTGNDGTCDHSCFWEMYPRSAPGLL